MVTLIEKLSFFINSFKIFPNEKSFTLRAPELVKEVNLVTEHLDLPFRARVDLILNSLDQPPVCFCGGPKVWRNNQWKFCSPYCVNNSPEVKEKKIHTCMENFGVSNPSKSPEVLKKISDSLEEKYGVRYALQDPSLKAKAQETLMERFGVSQAMHSQEIRRRQEETCLRNFGVSNPRKSEQVKKKARATCMERYGLPHPQTKEFRIKALSTYLRKRYPQEVLEKLLDKNFWEVEYIQKKKSIDRIALELGIYPQAAMYHFGKTGLELRIENTSSSEERELKEFLQECLGRSITSLKIKGNKSLDLFIPELNLAFEYNGLYWHSEKFRNPKFHLERTMACEEIGIRLVHIWSDDWKCKSPLMKRKIRSLLGLEEERIFARKCKVAIPNKEEKKSFYDQNHIKGDGTGSLSYSLYYQDKIVAMITFKNMGKGVYDLNRFATSCQIPGGFSKLLEHFKRNHVWKEIYTFADRSWSQGNVYLKTGFFLEGATPPTFYGIEHGHRRNRLNYTLRNLSGRFPEFTGTQFEIMDRAKIGRVWDCGQLKFRMLNSF